MTIDIYFYDYVIKSTNEGISFWRGRIVVVIVDIYGCNQVIDNKQA